MESENESEDYEVERILAEKTVGGVPRYLVKWQGYADEECTWEPTENFHVPETLKLWQRQKEDGDILEDEDLRRIQEQMDNFQAQHHKQMGNQPSSSEIMSESDSNELENPAAKRSRLVHEPPLSSNRPATRPASSQLVPDGRSRKPPSTKTSYADRKDSSSTPQQPKSRSTGLYIVSDADATSSRDADLVQGNGTIVLSVSSKNVTLSSASTRKPSDQPTRARFFEPELSTKKQRRSELKRPRNGLIGKRFKNLRHMNNARKRRQEERPDAEPPPATLAEASKVLQPQVRNKMSDRDIAFAEQQNDSSMFFSDESNDDSKDVQVVSMGEVCTLLTPHDGDTPAELEDIEFVFQESIDANNTDLIHPAAPRIVQPAAGDPTCPVESATSKDNPLLKCPNQIPKSNQILLDGSMNHGSHSATEAQSNEDTDAQPTSVEVQHHSVRRRSSVNQSPRLQPQLDETEILSQPAGKFASNGVATKTVPDRAWTNDDILIDLSVQGRFVGKIKIKNLSWSSKSEITHLKRIAINDFPIDFAHTFSRAKYELLTKSSPWNVPAVGIVKAFPDSEAAVSSLVKYLEVEDMAVCWLHPSLQSNAMMLLYSSESAGWQEIAGVERTRRGDQRLQLIFRTKLRLAESTPLQPIRPNLPDESPDENCDDSSSNDRNPRNPYQEELLSTTCPGETLIGKIKDITFAPRSPQLSVSTVSDGIVVVRELNKQNAETTKSDEPSRAECSLPTSRPLPYIMPACEAEGNQRSTLVLPLMDSGEVVSSRGHQSSLSNAYRNAAPDGITGLDRNVVELGRLPLLLPSGVDRRDIRILVIHRHQEAEEANIIREWLQQQSQSSCQVHGQPVVNGLVDREHNKWREFKTFVKSSACILVCDSRCPINKFQGLAKMVEHDNFVCWQIDLTSQRRFLTTTQLFPMGYVVAVAQDCFLNEPDEVTYILKWLKKRVVDQMYPVSKLILPPNIISTIHDQVASSTFDATKKTFLQLITLLEDLAALSTRTQQYTPDGLQFSLLLPIWEDVYYNLTPVTGYMPAIDRKRQDRAMSDAFFNYFGAWALLNLCNHRRFMAFLTDTKPQGNEHIRFFHCKAFVENDRGSMKRRSRARSSVRDTSTCGVGEQAESRSKDGI